MSPAVQTQATNAPVLDSVQPTVRAVGPDLPSVPAVQPGTIPWHTHGPLHDIFGAPKPANATMPVSAATSPSSLPSSADFAPEDEIKPLAAVAEREGKEEKEDPLKGGSEDH